LLEIFQRLVQELAAGRSAVLASIIRQAGSAPRSLGTKFLVCEERSLVGSIGGGLLEAMVIGEAEKLMGRDLAKIIEVRLSSQEVAGTDMICGGNVDVLICGFTPSQVETREVVDRVLRILRKGGRGVLAMGPLPPAGGSAKIGLWFYRPGDELIGSAVLGDEIAGLIRARAPGVLGTNTIQIVTKASGGRAFVIEPVFSQPRVIIFGGGHISVHLAPLLAMVDFQVVIVDDRLEFANPERFPRADRILVADYDQCFDRLEFTSETYGVIVTRGHLHDKTVLENVLIRPHRYVGMIGSRRKRNLIYEALMNQGFDSEQLKTVHSPIGLDIGAETPEEIALSIAVELVQVRAANLRPVKDWKV